MVETVVTLGWEEVEEQEGAPLARPSLQVVGEVAEVAEAIVLEAVEVEGEVLCITTIGVATEDLLGHQGLYRKRWEMEDPHQ